MQKILTLNNIPVQYDPNVDKILQILSAHNDLLEKELSENFIKTITYNNSFSNNIAFHDFYAPICQDCMFSVKIPLCVAHRTMDDICSYIMDLIDEGFYVSFLGDTFFIENYATYQIEHIVHYVFLYGYDSSRKVFYGQDYFDFTNRLTQNVSFQNIQKSFITGEIIQYSGVHASYNYYLLDAQKPNLAMEFSLDIESIKKSLVEFLNNKYYVRPSDGNFGIQFFDFIISRLSEPLFCLEIKHIHFIYVHIWFMHFRLSVILKTGIIINEFKIHVLLGNLQKLLKQARILELKVIKFKYSKFKIDSILLLIREIEKSYRNIIFEIINQF